jgi:hypothetical protein
MSEDLKKLVVQALAEGANPRGFSPALKAAHEELIADAIEANHKEAQKFKAEEKKAAKAAAPPKLSVEARKAAAKKAAKGKK